MLPVSGSVGLSSTECRASGRAPVARGRAPPRSGRCRDRDAGDSGHPGRPGRPPALAGSCWAGRSRNHHDYSRFTVATDRRRLRIVGCPCPPVLTTYRATIDHRPSLEQPGERLLVVGALQCVYVCRPVGSRQDHEASVTQQLCHAGDGRSIGVACALQAPRRHRARSARSSRSRMRRRSAPIRGPTPQRARPPCAVGVGVGDRLQVHGRDLIAQGSRR